MTPNPRDFDPLLNILFEAILIVDQQHCITYANQAAAQLFGYETGELVGQPLGVLLPERFRQRHDQQVTSFMAAGRATLMGERPLLQAMRKDGTEIAVSISISPINFNGVRHAVAVVRDASGVRDELDQAARRAETDALTGLGNRLALSRRLNALLQEREPRFAVLMLDLVRFKPFNDRYGHAHGDKVLQAIARRVDAEIRDRDMAARVGGDEFVVVLAGVADAALVERQAHRLARAISAPININGVVGEVGVSIGAAICPVDGASEERLLACADQAMYRAKTSGRPFMSGGDVT